MSNICVKRPPGRAAILLPLAYMAGIFWTSSIPGQPSVEDPSVNIVFYLMPPELQNLLHVPMFGVLTWLWHWSLRAWLPRGAPLAAIAFVITFCYGVFDELHQLFVPGRYASLTDVVLNTLGAVIVLWPISRRTTNDQRARPA